MKNLIGFILLVTIGIAAYFLVIREQKFTSINNDELRDFAIEDTAQVTKIFLSQPNGKKLLLTRIDSSAWLVNNSFEARTDAIELILKTLADIKVMGVVPEDQMNHTIKRLATGSTKVEFYTDNSTPDKTWYIGDATENRLGTYMLLEEEGIKSSKPYVTHLLMERGSLGSRFFLDALLWKDRVVMKCDPKQISSVEVNHTIDSSISFKIDQYQLGKFKLTNLNENITAELSPQIAVPYLKEFASVFYEYIDQKTSKESLDSVYSVLPRHSVVIKFNDGEEIVMKTYNMPIRKGAELDGKAITYHPERMYIYTSFLGRAAHPIVQNLTFDKLVPSLKQLTSSTTVEK
jgi:hypothetical protein